MLASSDATYPNLGDATDMPSSEPAGSLRGPVRRRYQFNGFPRVLPCAAPTVSHHSRPSHGAACATHLRLVRGPDCVCRPADWPWRPSGRVWLDCLNLTSGGPRVARQPVMVWIPGGMFEVGSRGGSYNGSRFARDGVVCVTLNYGSVPMASSISATARQPRLARPGRRPRVGAENITAFGGDPGNVTIFGESAGAMSVGTLLSMPRAEGLFRRAIAQSGAAASRDHGRDGAADGRRLAEKLGVRPPARRRCGLNRSAAQAELKADLVAHPDPDPGAEVVASMMPWQPVVDGTSCPFLRSIASPRGPARILTHGGHEHRRASTVPGPGRRDRQGHRRHPGRPSRPTAPGRRRDGLPRSNPGASAGDCSPPSRPTGIGASPPSAWPSTRETARRPPTCTSSPGAPGFNGLLARAMRWRSPCLHTLDARFTPMVGPLLGTDPPQLLAETMHAAWVAFATDGDCGLAEIRSRPQGYHTLRHDSRS